MQHVVAAFVKDVAFLGRCSVSAGCPFLQVLIVIECRRRIQMKSGGINETVATE